MAILGTWCPTTAKNWLPWLIVQTKEDVKLYCTCMDGFFGFMEFYGYFS